MSLSLFLVHCGYYDRNAFDGVFEAHADLFVVAEDYAGAKIRVKKHPEFAKRKMHVDGLVRIDAVDGHQITLVHDASLDGETRTVRAPSTWRQLNAAEKKA